MNDLIDVILATYEGQEFVSEQLESILDQTYKNFRVIVGDDGSKDDTSKIVSQYEEKTGGKVQLCQFVDNIGTALNFSRLGSFVNGDYVMFADQDDIWLPTKIEKTLSKMKQMEAEYGKKKPLLVHTDLSVVDENLKMIYPSFWNYKMYDPEKETFSDVLIQNNVTSPTVMINKALLELAFPIPGNVYMHDHWLLLLATVFGKVGHLNEKTMYYRQHTNNSFGAYKRSGLGCINSNFKSTNLTSITQNVKVTQANALYEKYFELMDENTKSILEKFVTTKNNSFFKEIKTRFHYNFYRGGFCRGIYGLFANIVRRPSKIENKNYIKK